MSRWRRAVASGTMGRGGGMDGEGQGTRGVAGDGAAVAEAPPGSRAVSPGTAPQDMLEDIFARQARFDAELARLRGLDYDMATWVQKEVLALVAELGELLDEVNFKWWKNARPVNREAVREELADILHFFVSACLKCGFSAREIYEAYLAKNEENFRRQRGLSARDGYAAAEAVG